MGLLVTYCEYGYEYSGRRNGRGLSCPTDRLWASQGLCPTGVNQVVSYA